MTWAPMSKRYGTSEEMMFEKPNTSLRSIILIIRVVLTENA